MRLCSELFVIFALVKVGEEALFGDNLLKLHDLTASVL